MVAVRVPVRDARRRGAADIDGLPVSTRDRVRQAEAAIHQAREEVELARPGAREDVRATITSEVRDLRTEADASAGRDLAVRTLRLEQLVLCKFGRTQRPHIPVHAELPAAELADQEVF